MSRASTPGQRGEKMKYAHTLRACSAVTIVMGLSLGASPALGHSGPITVTAQPPENLVVRHVTYADLNLASAAGGKTLNRRVDVAVGDLCNEATGGNDGSNDFKFSMMRCSGEAWESARPQIAAAVQRARDLAFTGTSKLAATAIIISLPK